MENLKIRIVGDPQQMDQCVELLKSISKKWGKRTLFQVRKYKRENNEKNIYNRSFGNAEKIYYVKMKVIGDPRQLLGEK